LGERLDVGQERGQYDEQAKRRKGTAGIDNAFAEAVLESHSKHGRLLLLL